MSQAAQRTLDLLDLVVASDEPRGLLELAGEAGLDKSTAARLLAVLEERQLVRRSGETRKYDVGPRLVSLGVSALRRSDLRRAAEPLLERLRDQTGETVSLHVRVGDQRICIAGAESRHDVRRVLPLGEPLALWSGPSGKVILAHLPEPERARLLARASDGNGRGGSLAAQLAAILADGYMEADGDRTSGVGAISVPVFGPAGIEAALSVSGPSERWNPGARAAARGDVLGAARRLSEALGGAVP